MSRALREYQVLGIKTTIPFFLWLMQQPEYVAGRYDTTYLDRLLVERKGDSFNELTEADEEVASIATALDAYLRATVHAAITGRCDDRLEAGGAFRGAARMTFDVEINGRGRTISIERAAADRYRVIVDGRAQRRRCRARRPFRIVTAVRRRQPVEPRDSGRARRGAGRNARRHRWQIRDRCRRWPPHRACGR